MCKRPMPVNKGFAFTSPHFSSSPSPPTCYSSLAVTTAFPFHLPHLTSKDPAMDATSSGVWPARFLIVLDAPRLSSTCDSKTAEDGRMGG